jgi:hypothetical protein
MKQMSSFRGRWPGNGLGNNLRLASSANETGEVKNQGVRISATALPQASPTAGISTG